jgi:hypothetical protein
MNTENRSVEEGMKLLENGYEMEGNYRNIKTE